MPCKSNTTVPGSGWSDMSVVALLFIIISIIRVFGIGME